MTSRTEKPLPLPRLQIRCSPGGGGVEGEQVGLGEVGDVDVVADAGAVGGRVVVAEDGDRLAAALGDLEDERDQVRLGVVALAVALP